MQLSNPYIELTIRELPEGLQPTGD